MRTISGSVSVLTALVVMACGGSDRSEAKSSPASSLEPSGAKISLEEAKRLAAVEVPNGTLEEGELEKEDGRLIYSVDFSVEGHEMEVHVDPASGAILSVQKESAEDEAREDAEDDDGGQADDDEAGEHEGPTQGR